MSDPVWPLTLPKAGSLGFTGGPQPNVVTFQPETGPPITRRRGTSQNRKYPITLPMLTRAQYLAFVDFVDNTLKSGVLPFIWVNPMTSAAGAKMKFSGTYAETRLTPDLYSVSFSVILLNG